MAGTDGIGESDVAVASTALADEVEALNSIYGPETLVVRSTTSAILRLPQSEISFLLAFPTSYPDAPLQILGTDSTGEYASKGKGQEAVVILRDVLGKVYIPGQVCLFDLVEEAGPLLAPDRDEGDEDANGKVDAWKGTEARYREGNTGSASSTTHGVLVDSEHDLKTSTISNAYQYTASSYTSDSKILQGEPKWTLSDPLTVNKSTFVARACPVHSLEEAHNALGHLLASNKKVAGATHNISAWRINTLSSASSPAQQGGVGHKEISRWRPLATSFAAYGRVEFACRGESLVWWSQAWAGSVSVHQ